MKPKEKANELFNNFYMILLLSDSDHSEEILVSALAKKCAIIAIDEILKLFKPLPYSDNVVRYWELVKREVKKL